MSELSERTVTSSAPAPTSTSQPSTRDRGGYAGHGGYDAQVQRLTPRENVPGITIAGVSISAQATGATFLALEKALGASWAKGARAAAAKGPAAVLALLSPHVPAAAQRLPQTQQILEAYVAWAKTQPPVKAETSSAPGQGGSTPGKGGGVLAELMAKPRLTPDEIAQARSEIAKLPEGERAHWYTQLQEKNAYKSQRDNQSNSKADKSETNADQDNMCNLTSLAMCFEQLGIKNPGTLDGVTYPQFEDYLEALRIKHGLGDRTETGTYKSLAAKMTPKVSVVDLGISGPVPRADWESKVGKALSSGQSVMMSIKGHIVRTQAVTDEGLVIDDPYGVINLNTPTYAKDGSERHSWSYDGSNRNDKGVSETEAGGKKGEDNVWVWAEVEKHSMNWARGFSVG